MFVGQSQDEGQEVMVLRVAFFAELWHGGAVIALWVECAGRIIVGCEQSVGQRRECHKADAEFFEGGEEGLVPAGHHGVAVLDGGDAPHCMGAAQVFFIGLGDAPVQYLALADQVGHRRRHGLSLHSGIDTVLVVEIDMICAQTSEGAFHGAAYGSRTRIGDERMRPRSVEIVESKSEFGGQDYSVAVRLQGLPEQFFIGVRVIGCAVDFRRVE